METNPRNPISESRPSKRGVVRGGFQYSLLFTVVTLASWLTDELGLCSSSVMVIDVVAIATTQVWSVRRNQSKVANAKPGPGLQPSSKYRVNW